MKKKRRKVKGKKMTAQKDEDGSDTEESKPQRPRLARELRALGITPTEAESINTIHETPREVYSTIDPPI
jgi:ribosomal 50S subunit-associated protein YjgA (DUF615 family)